MGHWRSFAAIYVHVRIYIYIDKPIVCVHSLTTIGPQLTVGPN